MTLHRVPVPARSLFPKISPRRHASLAGRHWARPPETPSVGPVHSQDDRTRRNVTSHAPTAGVRHTMSSAALGWVVRNREVSSLLY